MLAHAQKVLSGYLAGEVLGTYAVPRFYQHSATAEDGSLRLTDEAIAEGLAQLVGQLETALSQEVSA